jgi:MFS family permease
VTTDAGAGVGPSGTEADPAGDGVDAAAAAAAADRAWHQGWVFAGFLVLFSAAVVLVSEIVAARVIAPYVGITLETFSAVIGCVLAGISLGAWLGGVLSDRIPPRLMLGPVFVVGGLLLVASPFIVRNMGPNATASNPMSALNLAVAAFFLPSVVLSTVSPAAVKMLGQGRPNLGLVAGGLSAIGTAGALLGNFGAGFVLVGEFRTDQILIISGAACIVLGGLVAMLNHSGVLGRAIPVGVIVIGLAMTGVDGRLPCDAETKYVCLNITEEAPQQFLISSNIYSSSFTDVANPTNLRFAYAKDVAGIVAADPTPQGTAPSFGYVGGGGYTLPLYFDAVYPGAGHEVFEIDEELVEEVDDALQVPGLLDRFPTTIGDARVELATAEPAAFDIIVGDAFAGISVPWHLTTREFLEVIRSRLAPGGLYVMNIIDYDDYALARAEARTIEEVFGEVMIVARPDVLADTGDEGANIILVGGAELPSRDAVVQAVAAQGSGSAVSDEATVAAFTAGAELLTDDFAPVDQLVGNPEA